MTPFKVYEDEDDRAIREPIDTSVSMVLELLGHGWHVALVGESGSGKSTVMDSVERVAPGTWCEDNWTARVGYPSGVPVVIGVYPHDVADIPPMFARLPITGLGGPA